MKKGFIALFLVMAMAISPLAVAAETAQAKTDVTVTLEEMPATAREYVMDHLAAEAKRKAKKAAKVIIVKETPILDKVAEKVTPENIQSWGIAVAEGIKAVCHSLNVEVNDFVKTTVGKLTMALIVYKVVGKDAIIGVKNVIFTAVGYLFTIGILLFSYSKLHLPRKKYEYVTDAKGKEKKSRDYAWEYPGKLIITKGDMRVLSAAIHVVIFVLTTIVAASVI